MSDMDDERLDAALARALGPKADDTAPLSRAVLNRMVDHGAPRRAGLGEVLALPGPAAALMLGALLLAGALGYLLVSPDLQEAMALYVLIGAGF
jgi:hypothetical protein